jgi:hypothetical protein
MNLRDVERQLDAVLQGARGSLPEEHIAEMRSLVAAGEPGVALENFCTQLEEFDVLVPAETADELKRIADAMGMQLPPWCAVMTGSHQ